MGEAARIQHLISRIDQLAAELQAIRAEIEAMAAEAEVDQGDDDFRPDLMISTNAASERFAVPMDTLRSWLRHNPNLGRKGRHRAFLISRSEAFLRWGERPRRSPPLGRGQRGRRGADAALRPRRTSFPLEPSAWSRAYLSTDR
jgi:hypothetical protein